MSEILINPDYFPSKDAHFILSGPAGRLEVMTTSPKEGPSKGVGIICHPHPLQEGAMTNKVVFTTAKAFQNKQLKTIRFNFRGVGQSQGTFADAIGETEDLLAILDWTSKVLNPPSIWLAGFSFGAFVAAKAAEKVAVKQLITIAPGVINYPFHSLGLLKTPWLMIQGEQDDVVNAKDVQSFVDNHENAIDLHILPDTGHFFHGKLVDLRILIEQNLLVPE